MPTSRIAVTGSSGLIGAALVRSLRADGHEVARLVRRPARSGDEVEWDPKRGHVDVAGLVGCDAVVHLAGAGVGDHRWTDDYKREIRESRVLGTAAIAEAVASLDTPPKVLLSGSAIGFYGDTGDRAVDETAPPGDGFLPSVCEVGGRDGRRRGAGHPHGARPHRTGGGPRGWGVGADVPLFKAGLGGRLGNGRQYWSFIALHDHVSALRHILDTESLSGPVNLTGPDPVTNAEVTAAMGRVLRRPTLFTAPAPALRIALGEFAGDVLGSQRVIPGQLLDSGFSFAFPGIDAAIRAALR
ncbi:TIGR01777 family oxidoreductase [Streptomyces microflavus]